VSFRGLLRFGAGAGGGGLAGAQEIPNLSTRGGECLLIVDRGKRAPSADGYFVVFKKSSLVGLGGGASVRPRPSLVTTRSHTDAAAICPSRQQELPSRAHTCPSRRCAVRVRARY
jgi:hypothetical protein